MNRITTAGRSDGCHRRRVGVSDLPKGLSVGLQTLNDSADTGVIKLLQHLEHSRELSVRYWLFDI